MSQSVLGLLVLENRLYKMPIRCSYNKNNICYGTFDTSAINQSDLRRDVSYLGQSPGIFGGTIRENIVFDNEEFSEDDIISAMQTTGFDQVLKFTNGLS